MSRSTRFSPRSLPTLILAAVVLVVALAGASTAAKLITGKQIKNNTVTTKDIKDKTLKGVDVKDGGLTGADVKDGSLGPADLAASTKNEVRFQDGSDFNIPTCEDTGLESCTNIVGTTLAPGTWLVTVTVNLENNSAGAVDPTERCGLQSADATLSEARAPLAANGSPGDASSIALQSVVKATGAQPVALRCTEMAGENLRVESPDITALKVS
jgi:hypothetical protein